jgi:signal transduction histidine kinase
LSSEFGAGETARSAEDAHVTDGRGDDAKRRGGFLGFIAHEVRNPLSTALWSAELLTRMSAEERGGARGEKLSGMCLRSIARVRQLVEDHLLCERLDAGGLPLRVEAIPVREVMEALNAHPPAAAGAITLEGSDEVEVPADRNLLGRALDALVAVAGREGSPVRLTIKPGEEGVEIAVAGNASAAGATAEDPVKGAPSDPGGRALALPLVRRIAGALGGTLSITDVGFLLFLPRARAHVAGPEPSPRP